ncbi:MAG TPA: hypothetical protein PJ992_00945 [Arachnia sp.]|nr:hypothetical protein [Arachnia sp.]HMR12141.1 hypothetical protein [Arachnia sp.]
MAGHDWVYTNLTLPLQAHGHHAELTDFVASTTFDDPESAILAARLRAAYQRHRAAGLTTDAAFTRASVEVTGLPAPELTPDLAIALEELEPRYGQAA